MRRLVFLLILLCAAPVLAKEPIGRYSTGWINRHSKDSIHNYVNRFKDDSPMNRFGRYGSKFSDTSWRNPYTSNGPKLYSEDGRYLGRWSANRFSADSTSNPMGRYGSRFSDSINNPYSRYGSRYNSRPIYIYPGR